MHPSEGIRSAKSRLLEGKRIVLGITGSIAAVECSTWLANSFAMGPMCSRHVSRGLEARNAGRDAFRNGQ